MDPEPNDRFIFRIMEGHYVIEGFDLFYIFKTLIQTFRGSLPEINLLIGIPIAWQQKKYV